jgi:hypothetical protein
MFRKNAAFIFRVKQRQGGGRRFFKGPAADATEAQQPWRLIVQPYKEDDVFSAFPF